MTGDRARTRLAAWIVGVLTPSALGMVACSRAEPPTPEGVPWLAAPEGARGEAPPPQQDASGQSTATALSAPSAAPRPTADAPTQSTSSSDSTLLPQTNEKPSPSSPELDTRSRLLWDAIVRDEPEVATPAFFPLAAYQQVKDVADPAADWKHRLLGAFRRDIHAYHAALGDGAAGARLVALEVPDARAKWVDPGEEWNKIGYFRVFGSKLRYEVDGVARAFEIKSLISWRGQWYVVHLAAIK